VDDLEVMTTDNHIVNMTIGGYSPVGVKLDHSKLLSGLEKLIKKSCEDLELVEIASTRVKLKKFKVFGPGNSLKLSTTINKTLNVMSRSFIVCYGGAFLLSIAVMTYFLRII
jgi:predicted neutral ceramidase superfamily lipid hydrolase